MSIRKVGSYKNSSEYIQKTIDINRKIPLIHSLEELEENEKEFTKREYLSIAQSLMEMEIWDNSSWEERQILAPILHSFYDHNNCLVLIYPRFEPLADEMSCFRMEEEEIATALQEILARKGMDDEEIGNFIQKVTDFNSSWDMNEGDTILNLNNIGYSKIFGVRLIDFGLSMETTEKFYGKEK